MTPRVKFLSITQRFLLCIVRCFALLTFASLVRALCCPTVSAAPQQFERIVEARLGLLGFYSHVGRQATGISAVKADRAELISKPFCRSHEAVLKQTGPSLRWVDRGFVSCGTSSTQSMKST